MTGLDPITHCSSYVAIIARLRLRETSSTDPPSAGILLSDNMIRPRSVAGSPCSLVGAMLLAAGATAQRTFIVDANNGAGTHFTDLPPAFAAVTDGDRLLVRPGDYSPGTLRHGIQVVGGPGVVVRMPVNGRFLVETVGAGRTCSLHGIDIVGSPGSNTRFEVRDCPGLVVCQQVRVALQNALPLFNIPLIHNCDAVTLAGCAWFDGVQFFDATVSCVASSFYAVNLPQAPITANRSRLELTQCLVQGAIFAGVGHPGILAVDSAIVVRGDSGCRILGGGTRPCVEGSHSSSLLFDPTATLLPPPASLASISSRRLPALTASGGALGTNLDLLVRSPAGTTWFLFAALPAAPSVQHPLGTLWLDVPTIVPVASGVQGSSGQALVSLARGTNPDLTGVALAFQAVAGSLADLALSNPAVRILL